MIRRGTRMAGAAILCLALSALSGGTATASASIVERAAGLDAPIGLANAGDATNRLFIVEQGGCIRHYLRGLLVGARCGGPGQRFLDIRGRVTLGSEAGLLGLAFHPDYENNGFFFALYTTRADPSPPARNAGDIVIARYSVTADPDVADPASERILLVIPRGIGLHNGGQLAFGPDGFLYAAVGDGFASENAQDTTTLRGKILRIDVDVPSAPFYQIPPSNPFVSGGPGTCGPLFPGSPCDEIWAYGLRNPWRFSFDRLTGDLFIGDVGDGSWEEIDHEPAGSAGGHNYGWEVLEGGRHGGLPIPAGNCHTDLPAGSCTVFLGGGSTLPILEYDRTSGFAVIGGYVYRGPVTSASWTGSYVFGDFGGRIWRAFDTGGVWKTQEMFGDVTQLTSFGEDERGNLYFTRFVGTTGRLFQIIPDSTLPLPAGAALDEVTSTAGAASSRAPRPSPPR